MRQSRGWMRGDVQMEPEMWSKRMFANRTVQSPAINSFLHLHHQI